MPAGSSAAPSACVAVFWARAPGSATACLSAPVGDAHDAACRPNEHRLSGVLVEVLPADLELHADKLLVEGGGDLWPLIKDSRRYAGLDAPPHHLASAFALSSSAEESDFLSISFASASMAPNWPRSRLICCGSAASVGSSSS